jgi:nucleoside 2-deoxyribosyltransferase
MIYLAGPVFTLAERRYNEALAAELERLCPRWQVFLPQRYDKEFQGRDDFSAKMYACLVAALDKCQAVVALLDGADADSGTCFELGYACARGKRLIGVRTDFRSGEDRGLNLMLSNACAALVIEPSTSTDLARLAEKIAAALKDAELSEQE